jgi:hypothetical protein
MPRFGELIAAQRCHEQSVGMGHCPLSIENVRRHLLGHVLQENLIRLDNGACCLLRHGSSSCSMQGRRPQAWQYDFVMTTVETTSTTPTQSDSETNKIPAGLVWNMSSL